MSKVKRHWVVQGHHISYDPEWVVKMRKPEHFYITKLNRFKYVSKGFLVALRVWILQHEGVAVDLSGLGEGDGSKG